VPLAPAVFHILLTLAGGEAHGDRIRTTIRDLSDGALNLDPGSLYRLIARLHEDDLIADAPSQHTAENADARLRHYRLTPEGRRLFKAETQRLAALVSKARGKVARRGSHA
jgi:DNA-binding PadR family transcriptional regulator